MAHGDKNTKYIHHHASQRKQKNYIDGLLNENGMMVEDSELVEKLAVD